MLGQIAAGADDRENLVTRRTDQQARMQVVPPIGRTNRNVKQNVVSCFAQRVMHATIPLKRWEGRYALVCLNRGGAGRRNGSRG
jgi:hypothetical protein